MGKPLFFNRRYRRWTQMKVSMPEVPSAQSASSAVSSLKSYVFDGDVALNGDLAGQALIGGRVKALQEVAFFRASFAAVGCRRTPCGSRR
jgi:hypothetical protein